jgi:hypothetical protein
MEMMIAFFDVEREEVVVHGALLVARGKEKVWVN